MVAVGVAVLSVISVSGQRQIQILSAALLQRSFLALFLFDYLAGILFVNARL